MSASEQLSIVSLSFDDWMLEELVALVKSAYDESEVMKSYSYSEERVRQLCAAAIMDQRHFCGVAIVDMSRPTNDKIIGMLIGAIGGVCYSVEPVVSDVITYVMPEHRDGDVPGLLVEAFAKWAKRLGIKKISVTQTPLFGEMPEGFTPVGMRVIREVA